MTALSTALAVLLVLVSALFALRSWRTGRVSIKDRVGGLAELLGVATLFALALMNVDWSRTPVALWVVAVLLTGAGTVGLALRFGSLPWRRTSRWFAVRVVRLGLGTLLSAVVIGFALA